MVHLVKCLIVAEQQVSVHCVRAKDEPATLISLNCISRCTCSSILCCAHMLLAMQESEMAAAKISVKNVTKLLRLVCLICFCMQLA